MAFTRRAALAATATLASFASARAQTRWQAACAYPDGNFHTRNLRSFLDEVAQAAGVQVQLHSNGALLPMPQIKRGVQTGQVQIGEILVSAYGNEDPFFEIDSIPQLATSTEQARKLRTLAKPYVEARFARQGLTVLYEVPWPPSGLYTNLPVPTLETLRGSRMRTFNVMTNRFATLVGATPTLVQAAEIPQAFATGVVNVMVTSAQTGVDSQAWDFCKTFTPIGFTRTMNTVFIQRRALEALPAAQQAAIREAASRAEARGWMAADEAGAAAQAMLGSRGMTIAPPSAELLAGLATVGNTIAEEWVGRAGEDGRKALAAYRAG
ncbi:exported protein [Siccirubricoccus deserti]|uniref:TRAP transporter substrate-binding protein n=1 Tax=Siccirubricoccus deserti TaxID=2013562 RepID=A0A9X0QWI0_9PROT|nr:TRAP transporter substrate-binding protein [Siccirubricoccus deserti]MBC4015124.1 TRAP transporter substrate-binding protein [Siccirubricoccus deserti]GGC38770.1 exported protein [Siccirubricoccus deserti]